MNKAEFEARLSAIEKQQKMLRTDAIALGKKYIESNRKFENGQKVKVVHANGSVEFGIIRGYELNYSHEVLPVIGKIKKNGEIHPNQNVWYKNWNGDTIEVC